MDLSQLKGNWETLAQRDPMWAIMSDPSKKGRKWDSAEFFQSGETAVDHTLKVIAAARFPLSRGTALDFGCGLGRQTQGLARHFQKTYGVDISPTMITEATHYNQFGDACKYILNDAPDLRCFADDMFDFICSAAVLQHIPPDASKAYIAEFVRVLRPGGLLMFQLPSSLRAAAAPEANRTGPNALDATANAAPHESGAWPTKSSSFARIRRYFSRLKRALVEPGQNPVAQVTTSATDAPSGDLERLIEMHGIPREEVCQLLEGQGATVLKVQEEHWSGAAWFDFRYWATKQPFQGTWT